MVNNTKLKKNARNLNSILNIGKNGLTKGSLELINKELEKKKMIKIKILKSAIDQWGKEKIIFDTISLSGSKLVFKIGNTFVLAKPF